MSKTADQWKQEGNDHFKNKNYTDAIQCYSKAIALNSGDVSYFGNRAACYLALKNYARTIEDCDRAISIDPNFAKAHRRRALALMNQLKFEESLNSFKKAVALDKDQTTKNEYEDCQSLDKNYKKFFECQQAEDYTEALMCANYLLTKIPDNDTLKTMKVEMLAKTGAADEARNLLRSIGATGADGYYLNGIIELYGGDSAKAKKLFQEGMRMDPDNQKCRVALNKAKKSEQYKERGNDFIKENKYEEAEKEYTEALAVDPANRKLNSVVYSNRALTFMKRKQWLKALDDLNKSLELDPNYVKSLTRRGDVQMERGEYGAASMDYSKVQEIDPNMDMRQKIKDAQKKEKESKKKDYYGCLGLAKGCSDADLKKAYRQLAMKYHPDKNRSKSEAEQADAEKKFKEITEAYGVLSDPKKKEMYDSGQMEYDGDPGSGFGGMGGFTNMSGGGGGMQVDPSEIFKMFFGGGGMGGMGGMGGDDFGGFSFGSGMGGMGGMGGFSGMRGGKGGKFTFKHS